MYPNDDDSLQCNGRTEVTVDYKVNSNGTYIFKVISSDNKETTKEVVIEQIDKIQPEEFTIEIEQNGYDIKIDEKGKDAEETEESIKSGIDYYEYYVINSKGVTTKYDKNEIKVLGGTNQIYVIAYDKAGNSRKSNVETIYCYISEIKNEEDFINFQKDVSNGNTYEGKTVTLGKDLKFNEGLYTINEDGKTIFNDEEAEKHISIGTSENPFKGTFDGQGHEISGVYIIQMNEATTGLFGTLSQDAIVRNVVLKDSYIKGIETGGIAGYNEGKIYRCKVYLTTVEAYYGSVSGYPIVGGIASANNGEIIECEVSGYINNSYGSGGIAGVNGTNDGRFAFQRNSTVGKIYRCVTSGYIGYSQTGGIASHNGVYGGEGYIYDCYSTAKLEDNVYAGSIVSVQSYQGRGGYIYNSYYLNLECNFPSVVTSNYYGNVSNSYSNDTTVTATILNENSEQKEWIENTVDNGYPILKWQIEE